MLPSALIKPILGFLMKESYYTVHWNMPGRMASVVSFLELGILLKHAIWDFIVVLLWGNGMGHQNTKSLSKIEQPFSLTLNSTVGWLKKGCAGVSKIVLLERRTNSLKLYEMTPILVLYKIHTLGQWKMFVWKAWFRYLHEVGVLKQFLLAVSASKVHRLAHAYLWRSMRMLKDLLRPQYEESYQKSGEGLLEDDKSQRLSL